MKKHRNRFRRVCALLLSAMLTTSVISPAFQAKTVDEPQMAFLPYTDESITVDGVLDEALWSSSSYQLQKNLLDTETNNQADFSTGKILPGSALRFFMKRTCP